MYVYFIYNESTKNYKIGKTKSLGDRIKQLQTGNDTKLVISRFINDENPEIEKYLHEYFKERRILNEWFNVNIEEIDYIISIVKYANKIKSGKEKIKELPNDKDNKLINRIITYNNPDKNKKTIQNTNQKSNTYINQKSNKYTNKNTDLIRLKFKEFGIICLIFWLILMAIKYL